jgi:hypothetical protein
MASVVVVVVVVVVVGGARVDDIVSTRAGDAP